MEISDQEYKELQVIKECKKEVWCWTKFWKGMLGKCFWAFLVTTALVTYTLITDKFNLIIGIVWGVSVLIFTLDKSLKVAVEKAKLSAGFNVGQPNMPQGFGNNFSHWEARDETGNSDRI